MLVVEGSGRRPRAWRILEPVLVVLQQQPPRVGVARDQLQDGLSGAAHKRLAAQSSREQIQCLFGLTQAALGEAALVQGVAPDQVLAKRAGGPLAEADGALRVHPVADRDDGVEVVVP